MTLDMTHIKHMGWGGRDGWDRMWGQCSFDEHNSCHAQKLTVTDSHAFGTQAAGAWTQEAGCGKQRAL